MKLEIALKIKNVLGEGPVWSQDEESLYWVDIHEKILQRWVPETNLIDVWKMTSEIGSFSFRRSGGCLVALRNGLALLDLKNGELTSICDPEVDMPFTRFNDGKCDRLGRFWAGTMDEDFQNQRGALYCIGEDRQCIKVRGNVGISNGLGWSPDNKIFYYTDSSSHTIYAYDFDLENGKISKERIFAKTPKNYVPDGLTVDVEGYIWSAKWDGWKVVRYAPDGSVDQEIAMPVQRPTSCTFGGTKYSQLFITTASIGLDEEERRKQPLAGDVFVLETDVQGLPEPKFVG